MEELAAISQGKFEVLDMSVSAVPEEKKREAVDKAARRTPILGDVIQAKQTMDLFGKFRKKKDDLQ